jgi:hypothetical protein
MKNLITILAFLLPFSIFGQTNYQSSLSVFEQNSLSKLQENDTLSLSFHSQGCFHSTVYKLLIIKENNQLRAELYQPAWQVEATKKKARKNTDILISQNTLTEKQQQDFIKFENELANLKSDLGCTTTDAYELKSKYGQTQKSDGSCSWRGFYSLKHSFFND